MANKNYEKQKIKAVYKKWCEEASFRTYNNILNKINDAIDYCKKLLDKLFNLKGELINKELKEYVEENTFFDPKNDPKS